MSGRRVRRHHQTMIVGATVPPPPPPDSLHDVSTRGDSGWRSSVNSPESLPRTLLKREGSGSAVRLQRADLHDGSLRGESGVGIVGEVVMQPAEPALSSIPSANLKGAGQPSEKKWRARAKSTLTVAEADALEFKFEEMELKPLNLQEIRNMKSLVPDEVNTVNAAEPKSALGRVANIGNVSSATGVSAKRLSTYSMDALEYQASLAESHHKHSMKEARKMFRVRLIFTTFLSYADVATDGMFAHIMWVRRDYWWFSLTLSIIFGSHFLLPAVFALIKWRRMINAEDEDVLSGADVIDAVLAEDEEDGGFSCCPDGFRWPRVGVLLGAPIRRVRAAWSGGMAIERQMAEYSSFEIAFTTAPQLLLQVYVVFAVQIAQPDFRLTATQFEQAVASIVVACLSVLASCVLLCASGDFTRAGEKSSDEMTRVERSGTATLGASRQYSGWLLPSIGSSLLSVVFMLGWLLRVAVFGSAFRGITFGVMLVELCLLCLVGKWLSGRWTKGLRYLLALPHSGFYRSSTIDSLLITPALLLLPVMFEGLPGQVPGFSGICPVVDPRFTLFCNFGPGTCLPFCLMVVAAGCWLLHVLSSILMLSCKFPFPRSY